MIIRCDGTTTETFLTSTFFCDNITFELSFNGFQNILQACPEMSKHSSIAHSEFIFKDPKGMHERYINWRMSSGT